MEGVKKPDAVLFDWDGTLVDTLPGLLIAHNHVRAVYNLPLWSMPEFLVNIKYSSKDLYPSIYGDAWEKALETLYDFVLAHHLKHLTLLPDAESLIRFLHESGVPMGLVSNKRQAVLDREIAHFGWRDLFFCVFGSGAAARDKPNGDPITLALTKAAAPLDAATTWFIGDTASDLSAARQAGCIAVLLTHGEDKTDLIETYRPEIVTDTCTALRDLLNQALDQTHATNS